LEELNNIHATQVCRAFNQMFIIRPGTVIMNASIIVSDVDNNIETMKYFVLETLNKDQL